MAYDIYRLPPDPKVLFQGDIIDPIPLKDNLKGHQDYFAESSHFYRYMILTQTCDLDLRDQKSGPKSDFLSLCVIRKLSDAIGQRYIRVATPGWADLHSEDRDEHAKKVLKSFITESQQRLEQIKNEFGESCCIHGCKQEASTFRWLSVDLGEKLEKMDLPLCAAHALDYDNCRLPTDAKLHWESTSSVAQQQH
jgi:hypothetical protein